MVIRHNKHREDLWHLRFRESLSKKECVRKFVTDGTACRSEVYATLRQFESSTSCEYTTGHRPPGTVRRSQRRPRRTSQPPDQELNWRALASQRCRAKLKQAECTLPFGSLRTRGWQLFRGFKDAGNTTLCVTETMLARVLPRWRVEGLAKDVRQTILSRRVRQATKLFSAVGKADPKRLAFTRGNSVIHSCIADPMAKAARSIATALRLPGHLRDNYLSVIVSLSGASSQMPHIDVKEHGTLSLLFPLHKRWISVQDRGGKWRMLTLRAGDLLVMESGICHAAAPHLCRRSSYLLFVSWDWDISDDSFPCGC